MRLCHIVNDILHYILNTKELLLIELLVVVTVTMFDEFTTKSNPVKIIICDGGSSGAGRVITLLLRESMLITDLA